MMRKAVVGLALFLLSVPLLADKKLDDRMMHAASILQEIRGSLNEEAPNVLNNAYAVAVFPEFVKVGLFGGVKHGRGVLARKLGSGDWSKPAFVRITSGSFGLQFGVSVSQLLIVFKNPKAVDAISGGQFTIGADAGYAAGELGGMAAAGTDNRLENEIVAIARSKGLFAGVALEGGVLRMEKDSNVQFYNDAIGLDGRALLEDTEVETPAVAQHFRIVLAESVPPLDEGAEPVSAGNPEPGASTASNSKPSAGLADSPLPGPGESALPRGNPADYPAAAVEMPAGQSFASAAPTREGAAEGMWFTPNSGQLNSGVSSAGSNTASSGNARLAGELASRARGGLWDGAADAAGNTLRSNLNAKNARVVAEVGGKLADAAVPEPGALSLPSPALPQAARTGQWVEAPNEAVQLASASPEPLADAAATMSPKALPNAASVPSGTRFTGPPSPSEWPAEWLRQQAVNGACAQGS